MDRKSTGGRKTHVPSIREVRPSEELSSLFQPAKIHFADCYEGQVDAAKLTAGRAAHAIFSAPPRLALVLMSLRKRIVGLFGLKTPQDTRAVQPGSQRVGIFPVLYETADTIMLGMDDKHLDFRIFVSIHEASDRSRITLSTFVSTKNTFGKIYLASVTPFHRLLSRHMLALGLQRLDRESVRGRE